jgi:hypothetical protein
VSPVDELSVKCLSVDNPPVGELFVNARYPYEMSVVEMSSDKISVEKMFVNGMC